MKNFYKSTLTLLIAGVLMISCDGIEDSLVNDQLDKLPEPPAAPNYSSGDADLSNFVAIGNSLTAGFADGALYNLSQNYAFPVLLSGLFAEAGGGTTFNQPFINSTNGYNTSVNGGFAPGNCPPNPLGRFKLDTSIPGPSPTINGDCPQNYSGPALNNFGVPGIQVGQMLTPGTGTFGDPAYNPFYARFASNPGSSTIIGDVIASSPSFFTLWIGNNDVLGYALSGASNEAIFTSESDFQTRFNLVITNLMDNTTANGVVANIPPVTTVPYFRAISWDNVELDAATADQLNSGFTSVNGAIQACAAPPLSMITADDANRRLVSYSEGDNAILVIDEELTDLETCFDALLGAGQIDATQRAQLTPYEQSRPLVEGELVLLSAGAVLGTEADGDDSQADTPIGVVIPLGYDLSTGDLSGDQYYLTLAEQGAIQDRTTAFNVTIATEVATANAMAGTTRLGLLDVNSGFPGNPNTELGFFADLLGIDGELGYRIDGVLLLPDFSPNGIFSTDGIHPNIRGAGIIANEFAKVIESTFGANLPEVDVLDLPSVTVCGTGDCLSEQ